MSRSKGRKQEVPDDHPPKKRISMADRSAYELPNYSPERRELKQLVDQEVKSPPPHMKRRSSIQNLVNIIPFGA